MNFFDFLINIQINLNLLTLLFFIISICILILLNDFIKILILKFYPILLFFILSVLVYFIIPLLGNNFSKIYSTLITSELVNTKILNFQNEDHDLKKLDIKFSNLDIRNIEQINYKENKQNLLFNNKDREWYDVEIYHNNELYPAEIRIKGDTWPHFINQKKSWRIKFDREKLFYGIRILDLIIPHDRMLYNEIFALDIAEKHFLFTPKFKEFLNVNINGVNFGVYQATESYSKEMIESIFGHTGQIYSMKDLWLQNINKGEGLSSNSFSNNISAYKKDINDNDQIDRSLYFERFYEFLNSIYIQNDDEFYKKINDLLNIEKFIKWNAITWIFGADEGYGPHSHVPQNLKWFYNITDGKLEPIINEVNIRRLDNQDPEFILFSSGKNNGSFEFLEKNKLIKRIIKNKDINHKRNKFLWKLINDKEKLLTNYQKGFELIRPNILNGVEGQIYFTSYSTLDNYFLDKLKKLESNIEFIKNRLVFSRVIINQIHKNIKDKTFFEIELIPDSISRINIENIQINKKDFEDIDNIYWNNKDISKNIVKISEDDEFINFKINNLFFQPDLNNNLNPISSKHKLVFEFKNLKTNVNLNFNFTNAVTNKKISNKFIYTNEIIKNSNTKNYKNLINISNFLDFNKKYKTNLIQINSNTLSFSKGKNLISKDLVFDYDINLLIQENTTLSIKPNINLLINGNLKILGTESNPVIIKKSEDKPWGTFIVTNSKDNIIIKNLEISGGSENYINGITSTSQLSIFNSDAIIENSKFYKSSGEDALNIKNGKIYFNNNKFINSHSDAFDGDKVTGIIKNSYFDFNNGDSIDLSYSKVLIENNIIKNTIDKGVSVGETTKVLLNNNHISNNTIGLACKDSSICQITNSNFIANEQSISSYQKKEIFPSGGNVDIQNSIFRYNLSNFFRDEFSKILYDEKSIVSDSSLLVFSYSFADNTKYINQPFTLNDFVKDYNSNRNKFRNIENLKLSNINLSDDQIRQKNLLTNSYIPIKYNSDLFVAKNNYVEKYDEWKAFDPLFQKNFIGLSMEIFKND